MIQGDGKTLKTNEHIDSACKKVVHPTNPLILVDIILNKYPSFCCGIHEEEFSGDFESEEETLMLSEDIGGILFLRSEGETEIKEMELRDEVGVQCLQGPPVSLAQLCSLPIECEGARVIGAKCRQSTVHEPLVFLPRPLLPRKEEDEDDGTFQCKHCFKVFLTGQALGGHMSRKHPSKKLIK